MRKGEEINPLLIPLLEAACAVVIVGGIKIAAPLLTNIFLAWLLAYSISPLPDWLIRKRFPRTAAVLLTLLVVVGGGLAIAFLFGLSVSRLVDKLPAYQERLMEVFSAASGLPVIRDIDFEKIRSLEVFSTTRLIGYARLLLGAIGGILGNIVLIIFLVALFLF